MDNVNMKEDMKMGGSPSNPFREGRVRVNHNMSPELKRKNIRRELRETSTEFEVSIQSTPQEDPRTLPSSSTTKEKTIIDLTTTEEEQTFIDFEHEAEPVETIYNPAAATNPIRIYIYGTDPSYVEPLPLQWSEASAAKWEEEKRKWVKHGFEVMKEKKIGVPAKSTRSHDLAVYFWEWRVEDARYGQKMAQWNFFKELVPKTKDE